MVAEEEDNIRKDAEREAAALKESLDILEFKCPCGTQMESFPLVRHWEGPCAGCGPTVSTPGSAITFCKACNTFLCSRCSVEVVEHRHEQRQVMEVVNAEPPDTSRREVGNRGPEASTDKEA